MMPANVTPLTYHPTGDARAIDVLEHALQCGAHLVTNGRDIYVTPTVMPGEFKIGARMVERAPAERVQVAA